MRLADFIVENAETIMAEWVDFAKTCGPMGEAMDLSALRDHAKDMLMTIVADLRTPQSKAEQTAKSKGNAVAPEGAADTAAEVHGAGRAESGFTVGEMVSEYRALRASVIRLWTKANGTLTGADLEDLMRFNEAIDQSLAESVTRYAHDIDQSREMFMGILGHDLRSPLDAVIMSSQFMLDTGELEEPHRTLATRIAHSARRMSTMVSELLDFTRSRLGATMPINPAPMDLALQARLAVNEMGAARPESVFKLNTSGDATGDWDCPRLGQVLSNLLGNAVQHGTRKSTISVTVRGERNEVVLQVHNQGTAIAAADLPKLFSPFKRLVSGESGADSAGSLGLGLYIVDRIVAAHRGTIDVQSTEGGGTFFTVRLPRAEPGVEAREQVRSSTS